VTGSNASNSELLVRKIKFILLAVAGAALTGCVSTKVTTSAPAAVDFHQFHKVGLIVTDSAKTAYSKEGLPMFDGLLKGRLQSLGYTSWRQTRRWSWM
jgi:hypothetical protein